LATYSLYFILASKPLWADAVTTFKAAESSRK